MLQHFAASHEISASLSIFKKTTVRANKGQNYYCLHYCYSLLLLLLLLLTLSFSEGDGFVEQ